jgi:hypothetical protein
MVQVNDAAGVDYENTADEELAKKALDFFQSRELQVAAFNTDGVFSAQVWGTCPRCGHDLDIQLTLSAPVTTSRGGWSSIRRKDAAGVPESVEVGCGCGLTHAGAPEHVTGCGASFRLPTTPPAS